MARLRPLCPDRTSSTGCPLGVHCRLRHQAEPGEDDEIDRIDDGPSILVNANKAANGDIGTGKGDINGKKRCFNFWNTGQCKFGDRCNFEHVPNPDVKPRLMVSSIELSTTDKKAPDPFPSLDCLDDAASDQLLVPFAKNMRLKTPNQVDTLFASAKKNRSIKSAIQAEELLSAITSSSTQNDRWVSSTIYSLVMS